ncbi:MAG: hypothetical protein VB064_03435 [Oscillospiraceae bacterium]|nr:hypothetical protein [Oscillospiraceae bacterium]
MIGLISAGEFWAEYKSFVLAFAVMVVLSFILLQILVYARRQAELELDGLFKSNVGLYLERLEHNRRLGLIFRKPIMLLMKLDGYMKTGDDEKIRVLIKELDDMKLEPRDKVEYYQKRMSFFVSAGDASEARASFDKLQNYLRLVKADETEKYRGLIDEGREIIRVYLDRDVSYMDELKKKAEHTEHPVLRGVMYFRLAKLAYFKGDAEQRERYLRTAEKTLSGTDYGEIIEKALTAPEILETK